MEALKESGTCWINQDLVPFETLADVPASADIGLVFYKNFSENDRLIAHASGQLALFLQCGVPVIVDNKPSLRYLVETYHCGVAVRSTDDIFDAARQILADYEAYCQGALECFAREHDLSGPYARVRDKLRNL
ncbi:MAG: glycosyltransferase family 4 protein [Chloroflexaceae bacterium]|nr:glycosyltransferase family 4 protein [Chloroflexaceae bacterium]